MSLSNYSRDKFVEQFKLEVHNYANAHDPGEDEDWHSLTLGWAIGKGMAPQDAREFAHYIRYETDLG